MGSITKFYLVNDEKLKNLPLEELTEGFVTKYDFRFIFGSFVDEYAQVRYYPERKLFSLSIPKCAVDGLTELALIGLLQHEIVDGLSASYNVKIHEEYYEHEAEIDNVTVRVYKTLRPVTAFRCETLKMELNKKSEITKRNFSGYLSHLAVINPELKNEIEKQIASLFDTGFY